MYVRVGDRSLSGVLLSLSVIVMLGGVTSQRSKE